MAEDSAYYGRSYWQIETDINMQSTISIEQEIVDGVRALPVNKQQQVLDFVEFLRQKTASQRAEELPPMTEIVKLPIAERHKLLKKYIPAMAKDFANDVALTEFSELDIEDWVMA